MDVGSEWFPDGGLVVFDLDHLTGLRMHTEMIDGGLFLGCAQQRFGRTCCFCWRPV